MKSTKLIAICFLFSIAFLGSLGAFDFQVPTATDIAGFGTILAPLGLSNAKESQTAKPGFIPRSDIALKTEYAEIQAPSSGAVIYSQHESPLASVFSFPLGGAVAILHPESYISLVSGLVLDDAMFNQTGKGHENSLKKGASLGQAIGSGIYPEGYCGVRLFDLKNSLWINPLFLASWLHDRTAPVIQNVWLTNGNMQGNAPIELKTTVSRGKYIECQQATYEVSVAAVDSIIPGSRSFSAPYKIVIVLDGKTSIDTSFIAASCKNEGLSFLGNPAPSSKVILENGAYLVGRILLQRGQHEIEVHVSDYAGNESSLKTSIMVN